jgi:predicted amino acid-binding ACT domain protein
MTLWDFGRMESGRIRISQKIGEQLGLVDGSEVFSSMFKYESGGKEAFEIVLSPFGPENYREIAYVTFHVRDEPGALAQAAQFLKSLNVDILNSETVSSIPSVVMVWEMLVDLSFFGDSSALETEFNDGKRAKNPGLSMVDHMFVESSDLATRYTRGAAACNDRVKTQALRKTEKKASIVVDGSFELPQAYLNFLGRDSAPVMLIGEPDSWILSVVFLSDEVRLVKVKFEMPDKPGSVHEIMRTLGKESLNVLAGYTNVLVYYEKMTCELVIDAGKLLGESMEELEEVLRKGISSLGAQYSLVDVQRLDA